MQPTSVAIFVTHRLLRFRTTRKPISDISAVRILKSQKTSLEEFRVKWPILRNSVIGRTPELVESQSSCIGWWAMFEHGDEER